MSIQASASVELFSWLMGVCYIAFVTPELRERTVYVDSATRVGRTVGAILPWLDWLARFRIEPTPAGAPGSVTVTERGGRVVTGLGVPAALARGLPAIYLAWPLLALLKLVRPRLTDP